MKNVETDDHIWDNRVIIQKKDITTDLMKFIISKRRTRFRKNIYRDIFAENTRKFYNFLF